MQAIKIDNEIRTSLSISPFGKLTSKPGSITIYTCSHSLSGEAVRIFITLAIDCIEIKIWHQRLFREATVPISFATVNALITKFISQYESSHKINNESSNTNTNINRVIEVWDAIARSISINEFGNIIINTQHVVYFTPVNSARGDLAYLIYTTSRYMDNENEVWSIEFVSESLYPFMLEVRVLKNPLDTKKYITRIEQKYLRMLFLNCTLYTKIDSSSSLGYIEVNKEIKPIFEYIVDELIYDKENDVILVGYIKKLELQLFNANIIAKNPIDNNFKMNEIESSVRKTVIQTLTGDKKATEEFISQNFSKEKVVEEDDKDDDDDDDNNILLLNDDNQVKNKKGIEFFKNKVKLVQMVGTTRKMHQINDDDENNDDNKGPLYFIVREALNIKGEYRSKMSQNCIIQFLTQGTKVKDLFKHCSEYDLIRLSDACTLREINNTYDLLGTKGDIINMVYIILHGQVDMVYKNYTQTKSSGNIIGNIMNGEYLWKADAVVRKSYSASLCCIPTSTVLECIGIGGPAPREYMKCFWKSIRMWEEVLKPKIRPLFDPSLFVATTNEDINDDNNDNIENIIDKMLTISYPNTMNVTDGIRIRIINAGNKVFHHGLSRHFLYLIVHGECSLHRKLNCYSNGENTTKDIETGVRLMPGDFIFMDGENVDWIDKKKKRIAFELENPILRKNINKNTFDTHIHTMIATTRVEVCVVPISEIAKSIVLFTSLLLLSSSKYSSLLATQQDYEKKFENNKQWSLNRVSVLQDVNTIRKNKSLNSHPYADFNTNDTNTVSILEKILSELPSNQNTAVKTSYNQNSIPKPPKADNRSKSRSIKTIISTSTIKE